MGLQREPARGKKFAFNNYSRLIRYRPKRDRLLRTQPHEILTKTRLTFRYKKPKRFKTGRIQTCLPQRLTAHLTCPYSYRLKSSDTPSDKFHFFSEISRRNLCKSTVRQCQTRIDFFRAKIPRRIFSKILDCFRKKLDEKFSCYLNFNPQKIFTPHQINLKILLLTPLLCNVTM